jgi:hypothetical protein
MLRIAYARGERGELQETANLSGRASFSTSNNQTEGRELTYDVSSCSLNRPHPDDSRKVASSAMPIFPAPGMNGTFVTMVELPLPQKWTDRFTQVLQNNMGWDANTPGWREGSTSWRSSDTARRLRSEEIQPQFLGKKQGCEPAFDTVSGLIQRRCESAQPALARGDGDHPATDAALAGQPGLIKPVAGILVESGSHHDGQNVLAVKRVNDLLVG